VISFLKGGEGKGEGAARQEGRKAYREINLVHSNNNNKSNNNTENKNNNTNNKNTNNNILKFGKHSK
jgi:hypothetical protein